MTRIVAWVVAALALTGCVSGPPPRSDIDAQDDGALTGALRVNINLGAAQAPASTPQEGPALELGLSRASGRDSQTLGAGAPPVEYAGHVFNAPQTLEHDFKLTFYDAAFRGRFFFGETFGLEVLTGLAYADLNLAVSSGSQRASDSVDGGGVTLAIGAIWRVLSGTSVHGRVGWYSSFDRLLSNEAQESGDRYEICLVQALGHHAAVRAGYAGARFEARGRPSAIHVRLSGPMLGLEAHF